MRAITQARKMAVDRKPVDLEFLMSRWSTETHTFSTFWAKFGPTLGDVHILVSLPIFNEAQVATLVLRLGEKEGNPGHYVVLVEIEVWL